MKKIRRLLLTLSALGLLVTLSACGHRQTTATAQKRVTITFWHGMTGNSQQALNTLIRNFNHSQTTYKVVPQAQGNFGNVQQKITAAAKSQTLPTLAQTTYTNVPDYVHGGFAVPLDGYLKSQTLSQIYPTLRTSSRYQGKTYALPFSKSTRVLYYNRDLLKQYHLQVPQTWAALQRESIQVKAQGITGLALDQSFTAELDALSFAAKTPLLQKKPQLTSVRTVAATHVIWDMLKAKTARTAGTDGFGNVQFLKGKTLFFAGSSAAMGIMQASTPKGMHWSAAPFPSYRGKRATTIQGNDLVLFKSASPKQRRGAAAFMTYLLQKKQTLKWAKATGYLPLTTAALKGTDYQRYLKRTPAAKAAYQSLAFGHQDQAFYGYSQSLNALNQTVNQLSTLQTTPEKAMRQLQPQVEKIVP